MNPNRQIQTLRGIQTAKDTLYQGTLKLREEAFSQLLQLLEAAMKPDEGATTTQGAASPTTPPTAPSAATKE